MLLLRKIMILVGVLIFFNAFPRTWTVKREVPRVEVDPELRQFLADSIVPRRRVDWRPDGIVKFKEGTKEDSVFIIDVNFGHSIQDQVIYAGYAVIENVLFFFEESPLNKGFIKTTEGITIPCTFHFEDNHMYFPEDSHEIRISHGEEGYKIIYDILE